MEDKVYKLLNDQINKELYSAYLYLDMANFYTDRNLDGFAHWFEVQAAEEMEHGMKICRYLHDNDQKVVLEAIAKPDRTYEALDDPLKGLAENTMEKANSQAESLGQIGQGIEQLSGVVQGNAASSEENTAISVNLAEGAAKMNERVNIFKLF